MNILIPDSWLREYLITDAKPDDIRRCLSLSGPSVERIDMSGRDAVYDVEITTNRIDAYSVYGIAREASVILPRYGFQTKLRRLPAFKTPGGPLPDLGITILDEEKFCRRILAIKIADIRLGPSPDWLSERLEKVGQRPLNNIVDVTNYVMWELGSTSHAFDYDRLAKKTIVVREAKRGETLVTLDLKTHTVNGGELVFDDGTGTIIDLPSVMGTANSVVTKDTKNVLLLVENADPAHIRRASMGLGIRTQAATINEKGPDPEFAKTAILRAAGLAVEVTGGRIGSRLYDRYPDKRKPKAVRVTHERIESYMGTGISAKDVTAILSNLGFGVRAAGKTYTVTPPNYRSRDIAIPQDIIEEVARIFGYQNIPSKLPDHAPPVAARDPQLTWEQEVKIRLRDWGFTELLTYSMISASLMDLFGYDRERAYRIANPLSADWEYLRPHAIASTLPAFVANLNTDPGFKAFELSASYVWRKNDLPRETHVLNVLWAGDRYPEAKGLAERLFEMFGMDFAQFLTQRRSETSGRYTQKSLALGEYLTVGILNPDLTHSLGTAVPVTRLYANIDLLARAATPDKSYVPIPKHPPVVEDFTFVVAPDFEVGPFLVALSAAHPLVHTVSLLDVHENTRSVHVSYLDPAKNLSAEAILPARNALVSLAEKRFGATLKTR